MAAFSDPTPGHLLRLRHETGHRANALVIGARNGRVPLYISSSTRTAARQRDLVRAGRSATLRSKHLTGQAFDVDVLGFGRDQIPKWWFANLGNRAELLGLRWGGRWTVPKDFGHFEDARALR